MFAVFKESVLTWCENGSNDRDTNIKHNFSKVKIFNL